VISAKRFARSSRLSAVCAVAPSDFFNALLIERKKPIVLASGYSRACRVVSAT
jgi:hypothetical protein